MKRSFNWQLTILLATCAAILALETPAHGGIYYVTDTNDSVSVTSLRGAIIDANRRGGRNTILLGRPPFLHRQVQTQPWTFQLTLAGADEDAARTGDLDITRGTLTICGWTEGVTIDATSLGDRVFQVFSNATLMLENLTIEGGTAPPNESGGAIFNSGTLTIRNCSVVGNSSGNGSLESSGFWFYFPGGNGGGIYNEGYARLYNCVVRGNVTGGGSGPGAFGIASDGGDGAGVCNSGEMVLNDCLVNSNLCGSGGTGGADATGIVDLASPGMSGGTGGGGAGIFNAGRMAINFCTVRGNTAGSGGTGGDGLGGVGGNGGSGGNGGGILNVGTLILNTCTVSGNFSGNGGTGADTFNWDINGGTGGNGANGGGIYNDGVLNVTSCTIALNEAGAGGNGGNNITFGSSLLGTDGQCGNGGGIVNAASNTNIVVRNTLIALNTPNVSGPGGENGTGFDVIGNFTSQGFNLVSIGGGSTGFVNGVSADQVGSIAAPIDPRLGPLQMNGGLTPTHALLWGSPAIDQGNCFRIHTDQRGCYRPRDFPLIPNAMGGDGSDIGAFELQTNQP